MDRMVDETTKTARSMEETHVEQMAKMWEATKRALKAAIVEEYHRDFGKESWDSTTAKSKGTFLRIERHIRNILQSFADSSVPFLAQALHQHREERKIRMAWMLDQTTPPGIHPKLQGRRVKAREAEPFISGSLARVLVGDEAMAAWAERWGMWLGAYQSTLMNNIALGSMGGSSPFDAGEAVDSARPGSPNADLWSVMERIFRTEIIGAQSQAAGEFSDENDDLLTTEVWVSHHNGRVCPECEDNDGQTREEIGDDDPPIHPYCILPGNLVSVPDLVGATKSLYDGLGVELRLANGRKLTITQNHPVLTDKGFVAAKFLRVGDDVVVTTDTQRVLEGINPNYQDRPALVEDVFEAFKVTPSVSSIRMKASPGDFHGEARFFDGDVNVVGSDRLLGSYREAQAFKAVSQFALNGGYAIFSQFIRTGSPAKFFKRSLASSPGLMRLFCKALSFGSAGLGHPKNHRLGAVALANPHSVEAFGYHNPAHTELSRQFEDRFAGFIASSEVCHIKVFPYRGHVFDLQADVYELYNCNGVIVKNCRCLWRMVPKAWADLMGALSPEDAQALQDANIAPSMMAVRDPDTGKIGGFTSVSFYDWKGNLVATQ